MLIHFYWPFSNRLVWLDRGFNRNRRGLWFAVVSVLEQLINRNPKNVRNPNGDIDSRGVMTVLDGVHRLPADANTFRKLPLCHLAIVET